VGVTSDGVIFDISATGAASFSLHDALAIVTLGAQTLTLSSAANTFSGVITGTGGLTLTTGTETLTGTNTYSGATTINGGTLNASADGATAASRGLTDGGTPHISGTTSARTK